MQRDISFSGPVGEGYADGDWSVGGQEIRRPIEDAIKDLAEAYLGEEAEVAIRIDLIIDPHDGGYYASTVGTLGGSITSLSDAPESEPDPSLRTSIVLRGDLNWDPLSDAYFCGPSSIIADVLMAAEVLLGAYAGQPAAVNLLVVAQMDVSDGYSDLPPAGWPAPASVAAEVG